MAVQPEEVESFLGTLKNDRTKVTIGNFTLAKDSSFTANVTVKYNGSEVLSKRLDNIEVGELTDLLNIPSLTEYGFEDMGEGWEYVDNSEHSVEWVTPYHGYPVYVHTRGIGKYKVSYPSRSGMKTYPDHDIALVHAINYIRDTNPYQLEYDLKKKDVAREQFQEIKGIGERIAKSLIRKDVTSFEELWERRKEVIASNHLDEAEDQINEKLGEDPIKTHPELQKIPTDLFMKNL